MVKMVEPGFIRMFDLKFPARVNRRKNFRADKEKSVNMD